ncbi:MAG: hypothetical protein QXN95_02925 [Candidatus Bathyarchaeia archaeon]
MLELICLLLVAVLLTILLSDYYKGHLGVYSGKIYWAFRVAETLLGLSLGYFSALYINIIGLAAVLIGLTVAIAVSVLTYLICSKGLASETVDAKLVDIVKIMERYKQDLIARMMDAGLIITKDAEAKIGVCINEAKREIERLGQDINVKMSKHIQYLDERLRVMDEALRIVKEGPLIIKGYRDGLERLGKLCQELGKVSSAIASVCTKLETLVTVMKDAAEELCEKVQNIGASTKELKGELQKKIVDLLRANGLEVIEGRGRGEPSMLVQLNSKPIFVATTRAYNLSKGKVIQRSINIESIRERETALENNIDLVVFIFNVANKRVLAHVISGNELKMVKYVNTPLCLVEEGDEAAKKCRESIIDVLKRYISNPRVNGFTHT